MTGVAKIVRHANFPIRASLNTPANGLKGVF